jgi:hypothetical protein
MEYYSYIVARDFGFAPNPFNGYCTLCTCKPLIRKNAQVGDWIFGTGAKTRYDIAGSLIFAMQVSEVLTFEEYWEDQRFQCKKPRFNGSLKQCFGDNIYKKNGENWEQSHSHHSYSDGSTNLHNLKRDTKWTRMLISEKFYYFGREHIEIPSEFIVDICSMGIGHIRIEEEKAVPFINWLESTFSPMMYGDPIEFHEGFRHYDGL